MTDMKLRELLVVIDDHYGRARSLEERRADTQIYSGRLAPSRTRLWKRHCIRPLHSADSRTN